MAEFVVEPRLKGFICTTAHPVGCREVVRELVARAKRNSFAGPKSVLVIGASTGYGLASRIAAAFGAGAATCGVSFERPAEGERTASAGWYNTAAVEHFAGEEGLLVRSVNGDAFSAEIKNKTIELLRNDFPPVDLIIYSLASPRRTDPAGVTHRSTLKPIGRPFSGKTVQTDSGVVREVVLEPATEEEIAGTVAVMGGADWLLWMEALRKANVLAEGVRTVAYGYVGPELTWPIYRDGTIGRAKGDLEATVAQIDRLLAAIGGRALISINKAVVTQASAAIPVVPLYISLLFKLMKELHSHEDCMDQMLRLFRERLYCRGPLPEGAVDGSGRIRLDERELDPALQRKISDRWPSVSTDNLLELTDFSGYRSDFLRLFGFGVDGVDYGRAARVDVC
ncbi:MAG: trans-2-enoyl-CoA reductase family protein [Puniceicoccales bacterium]|jgi:enoyl-[acyl-carrier protein] reductase/trans-2-enoyl-CoA reductase (NAD+)|nr:trans-2-enoyl-CoA reductase family protein [Puniceicoccales bacterium]